MSQVKSFCITYAYYPVISPNITIAYIIWKKFTIHLLLSITYKLLHTPWRITEAIMCNYDL